MSSINTNGINVNYPVPGENNSTQGFRDNFANIRVNLNTAASEITDLQNKVVLKEALANSTLNNDMAGVLISNATTRGFRASTFDLGNAISGLTLIDVSLGDVQYGNIAGNTTLQFGGWAPTNTESSVILNFGISNANAVLTFPSEVVTTPGGYGITLLENHKEINGVSTVSIPNNVSILSYRLSTLDCGNTIYITPLNRPFQTTQIAPGVPPSTGVLGDTKGDVAVGPTVSQVVVSSTSNANVVINSNKVILTNSFIDGSTLTVGNVETANMQACYISGNLLYVGYVASGNIQVGMVLTATSVGTVVEDDTFIVEKVNELGSSSTWLVSVSQNVAVGASFTGTPFIQEGMILSGSSIVANTYIVSNNTGDGDGSTWTVNNVYGNTGAITITGATGIAGNTLYLGQVSSGNVAPGAIVSGTGVTANTTVVNQISFATYSVNIEQYAAPDVITGVRDAITCDSTSEFYVDMPIVFTGNVYGNLVPGTTYYVKDVMTSTDFSVTLTPGGTGATYTLADGSGTMYGNPVNYLYVCAQDYDAVEVGPKNVLNTVATFNTITLDNIVGLVENSPIRFAGIPFGGLSSNSFYYIKNIDTGNTSITLSLNKINGIAGSELELLTANADSPNSCQAYSIVGSDIWRQIPLLPNNDESSNISAANVTVQENLIVYGNTFIEGNLNVAGTVSYDSVDYGSLSADEAEFGNLDSNNIVANTLTVSGLVTLSSNANLKLQGGNSGQFLQTDGTGNLVWANGTGTPGNGSAGGVDTQVQFNDAGSLGGFSGFNFIKTTSVFQIPGDLQANANNNTIYTNNVVISNTLTANTGTVQLPDVANMTIENGNISTAGYYLQTDGAGNLTWAPGVTPNSVGNGIAAGFVNEIQYSDGAGNFLATTGFEFDPVTSEMTVPGNVVLEGNVVANGGVFANGTVSGSLLIGTLSSGASSQPNITSVGTLTSLTVGGNTNANAIFATSLTTIDPDVVVGFAAGQIADLSFAGKPGIVIGNSVGQHGAIVYESNTMTFATQAGNVNSLATRARLFSNNVFKVDFYDGTLLTPLQPYVTKVGTLSSLGVTGNVNAGNIVGNLANGSTSIRIPVAGGNLNVSAYGNANVMVVTGYGVSINGTLGTAGNIEVNGEGTGLAGGFLSANGNGYGNLDVTGNITSGIGIRAGNGTYYDTEVGTGNTISLAAAHALSAPILDAENAGITLTEAATLAIMGEPDNGFNTTLNPANAFALYANGKVYAANNIISNANVVANNVQVTSNATTDNLVVTDTATFSSVGGVNIPGGINGYYLQTDGSGNLSWSPGTVNASGTGTAFGSADLIQVSKGDGNFNSYAGFSYNSSNLTVPGNVVATANLYGTIGNDYQPYIKRVGELQFLEVLGNISTIGSQSIITSRNFSVQQPATGNVDTSDMSLAGSLGFRTFPATYTANALANSNIANAAIHVISTPNISGSNGVITLTNASTLLIKGAPVANGANMSITNAYALTVDGNAKFTGSMTLFTGAINACSTVRFANLESVKIGSNGSVAGYYLQTDGNGNLQWSQGTIDAISAPGGTNTQVQFNDNNSLNGSSNLTFDTTTGNFYVGGNANIVGNLKVGGVNYTNVAGTVGQVLTINATGYTSWTTVGSGSTISNGTSNIRIIAADGNIEINRPVAANYILLNGNTLASNLMVGSSTTTQVTYTGTRASSNGQSLLGNTNGVTYFGTPSSISNGGASLVSFDSSTGNVKVGVGANSNVMQVGAGGVIVNNGTLKVGAVTYTNVAPTTAGMVLTSGTDGVSYWSTIAGGGTSLENGSWSSISIPVANGCVYVEANTIILQKDGALETTVDVTGNITVSNIITAETKLVAGTGATSVTYMSTRGSGNNYALAIDTSTGLTYWRNVDTSGSSIEFSGASAAVTASGNIDLKAKVLTTGGGKVNVSLFDGTATTLNVTGKITNTGDIESAGKIKAGSIVYTNASPVSPAGKYLRLNSDLTTVFASLYSSSDIIPTTIGLTLDASHNGKIIYQTATTGAITITVSASTLGAGFSCTIVQGGTGQITFTGTSGLSGRNKSSGQFAVVNLFVLSASVAIITGDIST